MKHRTIGLHAHDVGRLILILLILLQLLSPTTAPVEVAQAAAGDLTKTGTDTTTGSTTTTTRGHNINWVVGYDTAAATPQTVTLTDQIRDGQEFVTGSLQTPPGWTKTYSNNAGSSYGYTPSGSPTDPAVTHLQSTGTVPSKGTIGNIVPSALQPINTSTGGDGWRPIVYTTRNRIYNVFHHETVTVSCVDMTTNALCTTGGPFPKLVSGATTPWDNFEVVSGNKFYVAASNVTGNTFGYLVEYNMDTDTASTIDWTGVATTDGLLNVKVGGDNRIYAEGWNRTGTQYMVGCYSITSSALCPGQPYNIRSLPGSFPDHKGGGAGILIGTSIYYRVFDMTQGSPNIFVFCFDTTTNARCSNGWASGVRTLVPPSPLVVETWLFPWMNAAGTPVAVCALHYAYAGVTCWDISTGAQLGSSPPGLLNGIPNPSLTYYYPGTYEAATNRIYFPGYEGPWPMPTVNPSTSRAICYDFNTQSQCAGFGSPKAWGFIPADYGYVQSDGCMYGLGHLGILFSFDPDTGQTPCYAKQKVTVQTQPSQFYCDGQPTHNVAWDKVKVWNLPGGLAGLDVTITNTATNAVLVNNASMLSSGELSIAGINYAANPNLTAVITARGNISATIKAGLLFSGDKPQMCYQTYVPNNYVPSIVTNTVTNGTPGEDATATLGIPGVTMTKAVDKATAGPGEVLTYSLVVTNIGGTTLNSIAVTDPAPVAGATLVAGSIQVTPAGAGTAGASLPNVATLSLAAGASATVSFQVQLPTTGLTDGQVITNTATATPPAGTNPVTATATTTVQLPDLSTSAKTVSGQTGTGNDTKPGDTLTYSVHVRNSASVSAVGVNVSDVLDAALVVPPAAVSNGGTYTAATRTLNWTGLTIPAASGGTPGEVVLTYQVQVLTTAASGTHVDNRAVITPPSGSVVNVDAPQLTVVTPDLSTSTKEVSGQSGPGNTARPGDTLTYTVTILNTGAFIATGVNVSDVLDAALGVPPTNISNGGTYTAGNRTFTWTGLTIPAASGGTQGQLVLTYQAKVLGTAVNGTLIHNTAVISPPTEGGPGGSPSAPIITVTTPDLSGSSKGVTVVPGP